METAQNLPTPDRNWTLFLDVDGTLIDIAASPDGVEPDPRLRTILSGLYVILGGAVALVSGRAISTLDGLFAPLVLPAAGLHGLERRRDQERVTRAFAAPASLGHIRRAFLDFASNHPGLLIEDKEITLALHYRGAPDYENDALSLAARLVGESADDLRLQTGKMMVEIRPDGPDKGSAIKSFMNETPFKGRTPIFIGDDVTDEPGFEVVNAMGGHSVRVGRNGRTAARSRIGTVGDLLDWLDQAVVDFDTSAAI